MELACPSCRKTISADPEYVGRTVACPFCTTHFVIPAAGGAPLVRPSSNHPALMFTAPLRFTFTCQRCQSILEGNTLISGQTGRCPTCGATFTVPHVDRTTGLPTGPAKVEDDGQNPTPVHAYANAGEKAPLIRRLPGGDMVIVCPRCSANMPIESNLCTACGVPFTIEGATSIARTAGSGNSLATTALVAGIVSLPLFICAPIISSLALILGIFAVRRALQSGPAREGYRPAVAAIICGSLSMVIFLVYEFW